MNLLKILILVIFSSSILCNEAFFHKIQSIMDQTLDHNRYDSRISPRNQTAMDRTPTVTRINFYIRNIGEVSDEEMKWKTQITFRMQWKDPRLMFDDLRGTLRYLTLDDETRIWRPDIFFSNSWSTERMNDLRQNLYIRIYPNGNVLYSTRLNLVLACPMDLTYYPFDYQTCSVSMASYAYTTDELVFLWKESDPVQITKNLHQPYFQLKKYFTKYCTSRTNTGEYSCLKADLQFERISKPYVWQFFVPTATLTLVSFVSFWMKIKSIRIKFLATIVLIQYLLMIYINNKTRIDVSYSTALDRWMTTCMSFTLAIFGQFIFVKVVNAVTNRKRAEIEAKEYERQFDHGNGAIWKSLLQNGKNKVLNGWVESSIAKRIDFIFGFLFPIGFFVFVIVFYYTDVQRSGSNLIEK